jgi:ABC-type transport system involved in multi-copper enzyme maturation permease subunit
MQLAALFNLQSGDLSAAIGAHIAWIVAALIIVIGLFIIGFRDLLHFRLRRVRAIAGVCFDESVRRRILWITPLAILGVIVVSQLQKPADEQDAIQQITKFCLFATGLVVVISTIILACSNLPREIENRVIYTVVTKPVTRLEIVFGKIVGFAWVSAAILLIMGVFTSGYLHLRAWSMQNDISDRLAAGNVDPLSRPALQHYASAGLLSAKTLSSPQSMQMFARLPIENDPRRYFTSDNTVLIPFVLPDNTAADPNSNAPGMTIHVRMGFDASTLPKPAIKPPTSGFSAPSPLLRSINQPAQAPAPEVFVGIMSPDQTSFPGVVINGGKSIALGAATGTEFNLTVASSYVAAMAKLPFIYISLMGTTSDVQFWVDQHPVDLIVPVGDPAKLTTLQPTDPANPTSPPQFVFKGRQGLVGQQLKGQESPNPPVCIYQFRGADIPSGDTSIFPPVPIEMRFGIERGGDAPTSYDSPTQVHLQVHNLTTGQLVPAADFPAENNRPAYASVPAASVAGGNFDVIVSCLSADQWINLSPTSLAIVRSQGLFEWNLLKSLTILWLLTVLVITIAIFTSTFLSWPIAVVLTIVILLGRWGVTEVGDAANAGLGRQFVTDFGVRDPVQAQTLSSTIEQLNKLLLVVSNVLPDINQFSATDDIDHGVSISADRLSDALAVVAGFGIPLSVLTYVFLKNKEVAP